MGYLFICYRNLIISREPFDGSRVVSEVFLQADEDDGYGWAEVEDFGYPLVILFVS